MSDVNIFLDDTKETDYFIEGNVKIQRKSNDRHFYLKFSANKREMVLQICKILGFDDIFTLHHLSKLEKDEEKVFFLQDFFFPKYTL